MLHSSLPAPVLNGHLKHSMRCFCALETQDILPEEPYHSFPLKTAINEPIHTHFPRGNYVRFTWDILTGCSTPGSPVRAHTVLILFAATWISVQLSAYQGTMWAAFATESWACWQADHRWWRFALPPLVLSTWGGTLELSGHNWLTHTWLTKEQKTVVVVSGFLVAVWSLYLQCILLVT